MHNYVTTYSGKKLNFLDPNPDDILLEDIIHHLSMICRYNGGPKYHYSVAQHSIAVAKLVYDMSKDKKKALSALFHDASEAYICDIPRPVKPKLIGYKKIETNLSNVIYKKFNIQTPNGIILFIDKHIVATEALYVLDFIPEWINEYKQLKHDPALFQETSTQEVQETFISLYNLLTA